MILGHQALALAGREGRLRAQGIRLLGITNELLGHYPAALRFHQEALALDAACPERLRLDHINLASVCGSLGHAWQAREHAWAALALIADRPPSLVRALALGNLASSERELGDFKAAAQHVRGAQAVAAALGAREAEAWLACRAATLYRRMGDPGHAQLWAARAWRLGHDIGDPRALIEAALELGHLALERASLPEAHEWAARAHEFAGADEFARYRGSVALLRAQLWLLDERLEEATGAAGEALEAIHVSGEGRHLVTCYTVHSFIALRRGNPPAAIEWLDRARQALQAQIEHIPDLAERDRFLDAVPLRRWLHSRADLALLDRSWRHTGSL